MGQAANTTNQVRLSLDFNRNYELKQEGVGLEGVL